MEIANGVHLVEGTNANVYIVVNANDLTVIDTGNSLQIWIRQLKR